MMVEYDMHLHSQASDGLLTVEQIFLTAHRKGLKGIAITDHDTVDGLREAIHFSTVYDLEFIPGIELSTDYNGAEVHILGYYINPYNTSLMSFLADFKEARENRLHKIVNKLVSLGYDINAEDIYNEMGSRNTAVGRPHIARALIKKNYFSDISEVFEKLLGYGKPAYVERTKVSVGEGIELILQSGGIPVLAHPRLVRKYSDKFLIEKFVRELTNLGLQGIEVYHSQQTNLDSERLKSIARSFNLVITGGSDCHGKIEDGGYLLGTKGIMQEDFNSFIKLRR